MSLREMVEEARGDLGRVRDALIARERGRQKEISLVHESHRERAKNLLHYQAFREHNRKALQRQLEILGLDPLREIHWDVLARIDSVLSRLEAMAGRENGNSERPGDAPTPDGKGILRNRTEVVFGNRVRSRDTRIMVTVPAEAADDPHAVHELFAAGADCFRINCARDDRGTWVRLIDRIRLEGDRENRPRLFMDLGGSKLRVSSCAGGRRNIRLEAGDSLYISRLNFPAAMPSSDAGSPARREIAVSDPAGLAAVLPGHRVWFDDGKIGGIVREREEDAFRVEITYARKGGRKLRLERGLNLPDTPLRLPPLTRKDLDDLPFAARHADFLALSFIRTAADVHEFLAALRKESGASPTIVIKIETREALEHLVELMLAGMCYERVAMLLARGDLAVECGILDLPRIQMDVVRYCEAAGLPLFWATGVLERMSRTGEASRAELTDAATAAHAQCVMLNRGQKTMEALGMLNNLLERNNGDE